jgi:hypothetical protein
MESWGLIFQPRTASKTQGLARLPDYNLSSTIEAVYEAASICLPPLDNASLGVVSYG